MTPEEWNTFFAAHWNFAGAKQANHIAMFPEELPRRLVKMFSFVGETVLDPFVGSGTTILAAKNLERSSVGYEINPDFIPLIKKKLGVNQMDLSGTSYEFMKQIEIDADFKKDILMQPYVFKDAHRIDKKIDVKKLPFGSRINKDKPTKREELFTVKEIISPEKILLSNGLAIRLLGIKKEPLINGKATSFLIEKTKGKRVFVRYDAVRYDKGNNLLCYLYLENNTFINAHLIKNGFVMVDDEIDFKYKKKFLQYARNKC